MKKTIKISAVLLALIMAVGVFAISPISASAAADNERVLLTFENAGSERTSVATNKNDTKPQIAEASGIDSSTMGGSGGKVAYNLAMGSNNGTSLAIKLPAQWYENKPTAIKFWAACTQNTASAKLVARLRSTAMTQDQSFWSTSDLSGQTMTSTGAWITVDISKYSLAELKAVQYLEFQYEKYANPLNLYVDDVTLVYDSASDVPSVSSRTWTTAFDWESGISNVIKANGMSTKQITASNSPIEGSTKALSTWGAYKGEKSSFISIPVNDDIKSAVSIRVPIIKKYNQNTYFGIKMNDKVYWSPANGYATSNTTWQWMYLDSYVYTCSTDSTEKIYLDYQNIKDVQSILFSQNAGDYAATSIDDIQYLIQESSSDVTASFTGADDTVADVANGGKFPTATISGKTFVGWSDGTKLYKAGATIDISENTTFTAVGVAFGTLEEASVRWSATDSMRGIKFTSYVNKADFDALTAVDGSSVALVGAVITDNDGKKLDVSNDTSSNDVAPNWYSSDDVNYYFGSAATNFTGVDESYLTKVLYAQMYLKVKYADGSEDTFTGTKTTEGRTMQQIAKAAYNDANSAQKKVLEEVYKITAE